MIKKRMEHYCCEDCGGKEIWQCEADKRLECADCGSINVGKTVYLKELEEVQQRIIIAEEPMHDYDTAKIEPLDITLVVDHCEVHQEMKLVGYYYGEFSGYYNTKCIDQYEKKLTIDLHKDILWQLQININKLMEGDNIDRLEELRAVEHELVKNNFAPINKLLGHKIAECGICLHCCGTDFGYFDGMVDEMLVVCTKCKRTILAK